MSKTLIKTMKAVQAEPDLVDRIFDYILDDPAMAMALKALGGDGPAVDRLKSEVRAEFRGEECYISGRAATDRQAMVQQVLALFNGRNATEVARRLQISRASVYRYLKQAGDVKKVSQFSGK